MENKQTTLVVLAAGMGSRFGGLKQIAPIGKNGEAILDFSVQDAKAAGFSKVVFIIKKEIEKDFRDTVGKRTEAIIDVDYAFQSFDTIPSKYQVPADREKPYGTGHAILCAAPFIQTPFAVINADDYYGQEGYRLLQKHLTTSDDLAMVAYLLKNTVTENGTVSRGVCTIEDGMLTEIEETFKIEANGNCEKGIILPGDTPVSMNFWGLTPDILPHLAEGFDRFLSEQVSELKSEYFLPNAINELIVKGIKRVKVLQSTDKWYGMTYREDLESVRAALANRG